MINDHQATTGTKAIVSAITKLFLSDQRAKFIGWQRTAFDEFPGGANREQLNRDQQQAKLDDKPFEPDTERAEDYAKSSIEFGVGQRLKGAYACYRADMQLECIRHILLALGSVCQMLEWDKASEYINQQNNILLDMKRAEEEAA
jgi:hypothetical protein